MLENRFEILFIVDNPVEVENIIIILDEKYKVRIVKQDYLTSGILKKITKPDLILLDIQETGAYEYEVCRILKSDIETRDIPIIFLTEKISVEKEIKFFMSGAIDYIVKPVSSVLLNTRVSNYIFSNNKIKELEKEILKRKKEIEENQIELINCLVRASKYKDNQTGSHIKRVSLYSKLLAEFIGKDSLWCKCIYQAAAMHDIGKVGVPDTILNKPANLLDSEWEIMKSHVKIGAEIIGRHDSELLNMARDIILTHHERWDGNGYPSGIKGENIPLAGRITAIADTFDALTSNRPYKKAWKVEEAMLYLKENASIRFDPNLVNKFIYLKSEVMEIYNNARDSA